MRIIAITNQKGGCGKTTTAINLAASLALNGKKTLLIDLDPQAHATLGLNIKADTNIYNVLSRLSARKARINEIIQKIDDNFDIAPSNIELSTLEQELAGEIGRESRLWDTLNNYRNNYEFILIDCPPNLGILTINAIRAADEIIVPAEASRFSIEGLKQLLGIIKLVRERLEHKVEHKILVTNFDSRLRHSFNMLDKIKSTFKNKLYTGIIHINVKLKEAQNQGTHVFNYDKYSRGAKDYFSLAREIITAETSGAPQAAAAAVPAAATQPQIHIIGQKMQEILKEHLPKLIGVNFCLNAPDAKDVYVVGDFNDWQTDPANRMLKMNGVWKKRIQLSGGQHRYRFVIDGKWTDDPSNPDKELNPYGEMDSILKVKE